MNKRTQNICQLARYGTEIVIKIPLTVLYKIDKKESFKEQREALQNLKKDDDIEISEEEIRNEITLGDRVIGFNGYTIITIKMKEMDKYEAFKEWGSEQRIHITRIDLAGVPCDTKPFIDERLNSLFKGFEKSLEEKNREKDIKNILRSYFKTEAPVNELYQELHDGEYLK